VYDFKADPLVVEDEIEKGAEKSADINALYAQHIKNTNNMKCIASVAIRKALLALRTHSIN
jgi:hypothetical protein